MERKIIGVITKPQALKGEFRIKPSLLNLKKYKKLETVFIGNDEYSVESVSLRDTFVVMKVKGVDDCNSAEKLRNIEIYANVEETPEQSVDLIDYEVVCDGLSLGKIVDINNYGSKDIVSVAGDKNFMFPVIDNLIENISNDKIVVIKKEILEQVVVYED